MSTLVKIRRSAVKGKVPSTAQLQLGELAVNTVDGKLYLKTEDSAAQQLIHTIRQINAGAGLSDSEGTLYITNTGVSAAQYGSSTQIPVITVNTRGQITTLTTTTVAGVSSIEYDSDTGVLTVNTADGGIHQATINLNPFSTTDLAEGVNLYYTTARADSDFDVRLATKSTTNVAEGTNLYYTTARANTDFDSRLTTKSTSDLAEGSNLYYTTARHDSDFSAILALTSTDSVSEGSTNLYYTTARADSDFDTRLTTKSTSDVAEGTNLYYTTGRADSDFDVRLATKSTSDVAEGTNLYYTTARFDSDFGDNTTDLLTEGETNLYYTDTRARKAVSVTDAGGDGSLAYDSGTGVFTYTGPSASEVRAHISGGTGITFNSGVIATTITQYTDDLAHAAFSVTDAGGDGSLTYHESSGTFTFTGPSASEVRAHFSGGTGITLTDGVIATTITQYTDSDAKHAINVDDTYSGPFTTISYGADSGVIHLVGPDSADVRSVLSAGGDLSYNSVTGEFSFTERTDAEVRGLVSAVDAGGDGSFSYNSSNGQFTYTGPSASETRAHFSGGTGVTITDGVVAIGQSVGTTDDVTFGKIVTDSADVNAIYLDKLASAPSNAAGTLFYDSDPTKGLSFIPTTNEGVQDVTINIGQEVLVYVHNLTGAQINNGQAVYISGVAHGAHPQVTLAKADAAATAVPIGLATQDIPDGAHGYVTKVGLVRDVNTTGMTAGGTAYLSKDSAGQWSTTEVSVDSGYPTHLGTVLTVGEQGSILVNVEKEHFEYLKVQDKIVTNDLIAPDIYGSHIHFDGKDPGHYKEGLIYYDSANGALVVKNDEPDITLQIGQEEWIRVYNNSGADITNGTPVYLSGENNGLPTIEEADAVNAYGSVGLATHDIENGTVGYVTTRGLVSDINTQGLTVGTKVHVAAGGGFANTAPAYPYYPTDLGICLVEDSAAGVMYVDVIDHTMETIRVTQDARFDANVTVGGNLNVIGVTTSVLSQSLTTSGNLLQLLDGDTVGTAYQSVGGLNDAAFKGKYTGDSDVFYFVRMYSVDSAGAGDVIEWGISDSDTIAEGAYGIGFDSAGGPVTWNLKDDGLTAPLRNGLSIQFINLSGHDSADVWCAHPTELNLDLGMIGNYNQANEPLKYAGVVRDATDERWKFFDAYPAANVDSSSTQFDINFDSATLSDIQFATAYGNLSGNASTATSATQLATGRTIALSGDITSTGVSFNGTSNITLSTAIAAGVITNADINTAAEIADTKLATISTSGKVQNSATTATASNTASAIVTRDVSGNFSAGIITATLSGQSSTVASITDHQSTVRGWISVDSSGLGYNSTTGVLSLLNPGVDSAGVQAIFSVDSSGNTGLGSLTYNGAGQFVYNGPDSADIRGVFSASTYLTLDANGVISTNATSANTASTLVARDGSGNFSAGTITANLAGTASNATTLNTQVASYYLDHNNFTNKPNAFTKFKIDGLDTFEPDSANDVLVFNTGPGLIFTVDSASDAMTLDTVSSTPMVTDLFTASSGQTSFTMSSSPTSEDEMMVFVEGVYQNKNSYSITGSTLTLDDSVATGAEVVVHQVGANLVSGDVVFGQAVSGTRSSTFASATTQTIASFDKTKYRSMTVQVQVTDNVDDEYEMSQVHLIHDGTTVTTTEYGTIYTGDSDLGDFDATISGGDLQLQFTATNANSKTVKLHFNAIKV